MRRSLLLVALLSASLAPCVAATDGVPAGWRLAGDRPYSYRTGADGNGTAFLVSKLDAPDIAGFGTLMQSIKADEFAGKRVRFHATVCSEDLTGWAGLWMRVDHGSKTVAFDNMERRPIKGTSGWARYDVVLDVPADATNISFGVLVASNGGVWLRGVGFEPVGEDVPTTGSFLPVVQGMERLDHPVNLDFSK